MRDRIEMFSTDWATLARALPPAPSPVRTERLRRFLAEALADLDAVDFASLDTDDDRIDFRLFRNHLEYERRRLEIQARRFDEIAPLVPFAPIVLELEEARRRMEPLDAAHAADRVDAVTRAVTTARNNANAAATPDQAAAAQRAAATVDALRATLDAWFRFYDGYDPLFSWWVRAPFQTADAGLAEYATFLRETVAGLRPDDPEAIVGTPVGRDALLSELAHEMIPYTPEELIAIGEREYAWCENEMRRAARELGFGDDDWRAAMEHVKTLHVPPGQQPELVRELAVEAIEFLDEHDLVTIPELARESWRRDMMSPERQRVNPFFLGGEVIIISFPTDTMSHERKRMSLRGNNRYFARATVQHELIPGHHLQLFMADRYRTHRKLFRSPFYIEGWALHWEMLLWELGFAATPEQRIGMLFWRMHRCVRIVFSLRFHLEQMTPAECVDMLVERVGHERENAVGEVRRSCGEAYPPLYQCAYLLGGLQVHALYNDWVGSGKMTPRAFHDAILQQNSIPISLLRAALSPDLLTGNGRDALAPWRFAGEE